MLPVYPNTPICISKFHKRYINFPSVKFRRWETRGLDNSSPVVDIIPPLPPFVTLFSILFYPITLEGRRGTTEEFATTLLHLFLFSASLVDLAKSIPVHFLILSSHHFFCLPLVLFSFHCAL